MRRQLKIRLFRATVESILLYGSETWTVTEALAKWIDGCYTRMLRMALDVPWYLRVTNSEVYGRLSRVTETIRGRRLRLTGHVERHEELIARDLLFWDPTQATHGSRGRGRPKTTYVDVLMRDTGLDSLAEIQRMMQDRVLWRQFIMSRTLKPP